MRFSCDECGRSYVASDEIAGRAFRMRCKECGSEVIVRPPADPSAFVTPGLATPAPAREARQHGGEDGPRPAFDPFGDLPEVNVAVGDEALEILERTPPPRPSPEPRPAARAAAPPEAPPATTRAAPSTALRPRPGRMLPAEDEAMLGPPGAEDRRSLPRWLIFLAVGALAAAGGLALLR